MRSFVKFIGLLAITAGSVRGVLACLDWIRDGSGAAFLSGVVVMAGLMLGAAMIIREELRRDSLQGMRLFTRR